MEYDGFNFNREEARGLEIEVELPLMTSGKSFNLRASEEQILLKCGRFYELYLTLPIKFERSKLQAFFDVDRRVLTLTVLFKQKKQQNQEEQEEPDTLKLEQVTDKNIIIRNEEKIKKMEISISADLLTEIF